MRRIGARVADAWRRAWRRVRRAIALRQSAPLGIFGAPNAGKSSLANVFCEDWSGEVLSSVSPVPHETREVKVAQKLLLSDGNDRLVVDVLDTPGLSAHVTATDLELFHGMSRPEAQRRAREAMRGMIDSVKALEKVEGILLVIDSTTDPRSRVNQVLIEHAVAKRTPLIVVANKIDLPGADVDRVVQAYGGLFPVIAVSAATRQNIPELYRAMFREFDA